jgi:cellulose synthase/poly-beta-1,6-N-acetylglucosamine synthase-like glycosyltransferase
MYGAAEMYMNPEVAIVQHYTSVVQVAGDFFENGAAYFAKMCYMQIRFTVSGGEASPFVGHNAFVRWAAVQDVGMEKGYTGDQTDVMYWSEYHISEDFNMSVRLQSAGWVTRYAAYHKEEFKEMVSLTIYDEISRWERYAYGDSEMIFNPVWSWIWRGPFTKLFRNFVFCDMHLSSKLNIISYMTSCKLRRT